MEISPWLLRADLYNAPSFPANQFLPDSSASIWQPTVVTLITGQHEGVLVNARFTAEQGLELADWLKVTLGDKRLSTIFITHGHGDHWFNVKYLTERFSGVEVVATQESIDHMETQLTPDSTAFWDDVFHGLIDEASFEILAKPLADNKYTLEGHTLEAITVGHSDTEGTSFLHVPSLNLSVAGDILYNDVHMWMAESTFQCQRDAWIRSLDELEAFDPAIVIGSHHKPGGVDGAFNIEASRNYIRVFSKLVTESSNAKELYDKALDAFPTRLGKLVLWLGCQAIFSEV
jgi:glyoxylase-like metal-dependent hydrolase (beta-lactamase superfamily II)